MEIRLKHIILLLLVWTVQMTGAAKSDTKTIKVLPSPCVVSSDSLHQVRLDLTVKVPARYFSRRSRLIIVPQLVANDSVLDEYLPLVVDAPIYNKKLDRKKKLEHYVDPYSGRAMAMDKVKHAFELPYHAVLEVPEGLDNGRIRGVVTTDGCGECTGIDTIDMAAIANPITLMPEVKEGLRVKWIEPKFVIRPKVQTGRGVAHLQFIMNKYDINVRLGNNAREVESMVNKLLAVLSDSLATLNSLSIYGVASADGPLPFNTQLALDRANSAKNYLVRILELDHGMQRMIETGSRPEGWGPVLDAMIADGHSDSTAVRAILEKYAQENDDVQEYHIRRLPCWKDIRARYLQKDRKVVYEYTYTIRSFTDDAELLDMYAKRPDAFNEDEMLRVATLAQDDESRMQVYETIMQYFPQSQVAANNLAVLYLRQNREEEARCVLEQLDDYSDETLNALAASYIYKEDYEHAIELLQGVDNPLARYNLGLLKARQRKLKEAYDLLRPFADVNSAICALSINANEDAGMILKDIADEQPLTEYVRALLAARRDRMEEALQHLKQSCREDRFKTRALSELDFMKYRDDNGFRAITEIKE